MANEKLERITAKAVNDANFGNNLLILHHLLTVFCFSFYVLWKNFRLNFLCNAFFLCITTSISVAIMNSGRISIGESSGTVGLFQKRKGSNRTKKDDCSFHQIKMEGQGESINPSFASFL